MRFKIGCTTYEVGLHFNKPWFYIERRGRYRVIILGPLLIETWPHDTRF